MSQPPHGCAKCDKRWGGYGTCHCGMCHLTFTSLSSFTAHRRHNKCIAPEDAGLVLSDREYPCWKSPGTADYWEPQ